MVTNIHVISIIISLPVPVKSPSLICHVLLISESSLLSFNFRQFRQFSPLLPLFPIENRKSSIQTLQLTLAHFRHFSFSHLPTFSTSSLFPPLPNQQSPIKNCQSKRPCNQSLSSQYMQAQAFKPTRGFPPFLSSPLRWLR